MFRDIRDVRVACTYAGGENELEIQSWRKWKMNQSGEWEMKWGVFPASTVGWGLCFGELFSYHIHTSESIEHECEISTTNVPEVYIYVKTHSRYRYENLFTNHDDSRKKTTTCDDLTIYWYHSDFECELSVKGIYQ